MVKMKAIIPVAGIGERLRPFTLTKPKALLPVAGKPILSHIIESLIDYGVEEFVLVLGYMGEKIRNFITENYPNKAKFVYQDKLLGLGYAVKLALDLIGNSPFIILLGDTIAKLPQKDNLNPDENYVGLVEVDEPERFGVAIVKDNYVLELEEKPKYPRSKYVLAGVYIINKPASLISALNEVIEKDIRTHGEFQLTDALVLMLQRGERIMWFNVDEWYDCGTPESLIKTNRSLLKKVKCDFMGENSIIIQPSYIDISAKIRNSVIGPYVSVGSNSVIEESVIRNSIIGDGSYIRQTVLDSSVVGNEVIFVGKCFRLNIGDSSRVFLEWQKEREQR
ncbi:MAG: sugar phosphate nucleotidyltransferase [bacterium]